MKNNFISIPSIDGPIFHCIREIIVSGDNRTCVFLTDELKECDFDVHTQAFRVERMKSFEQRLVFRDDLKSATPTYINKASNAFNYITKRWI